MKSIKVLIVEDEMIIAKDLTYHLQEIGVTVCGILIEGEAVEDFLKTTIPDIILMDISLKGEMSGIDTVIELQKNYSIPVVYLTANTDDHSFNLAKATKPFAFIEKPFKKRALIRTIELLIEQLLEEEKKTDYEEVSSFILNDRIFVKSKNALVKIFLKDILYIQAERAYCQIFTKERNFVLSTPLKNFEDQIAREFLIRVHRSYIINLLQIEGLEDNVLLIHNSRIPVSKTYYEELVKRLTIL